MSQALAGSPDAAAAMFGGMPDISINTQYWGIGPTFSFGGRQASSTLQAGSAGLRAVAGIESAQSQDAARMNSFTRREQEWAHQSNVVATEIGVLYKQLRAAQIREAVAQREWDNHKKQMSNAREIEKFLTDERQGKATGQALYSWMRRETRGLYGRALNMALDVARKAEQAMQHELGKPGSFIQTSYSAGRDGLLAGERLTLDLLALEAAYRELNKRELELREDVSLLQLAPRELMKLRSLGSCVLDIEESFFDRRTPGHHYRRLKSVAVSIPCVTGPHTRVHCTLTLLSSSIRIDDVPGNEYARKPGEEGLGDIRFNDNTPNVGNSIVTSSAQNDEGLFDASGDERYLPFEGSGAISKWSLSLPETARDFDYGSISDVILHLRYTARSGPPAKVVTESFMKSIEGKGGTRLFSLQYDFPNVLSRLRAMQLPGEYQQLVLSLLPEHYPYWVQSIGGDARLPVAAIDVFAMVRSGGAPSLRIKHQDASVEVTLAEVDKQSGLYGATVEPDELVTSLLTNAFSELRCEVKPAGLLDLWFAITWKKSKE
jgi:hypothetical protein